MKPNVIGIGKEGGGFSQKQVGGVAAVTMWAFRVALDRPFFFIYVF